MRTTFSIFFLSQIVKNGKHSLSTSTYCRHDGVILSGAKVAPREIKGGYRCENNFKLKIKCARRCLVKSAEIENSVKVRWWAIFHATHVVTIFGGYQDPLYIIGGGTVLYSTHKQRTFAPHNIQAGNWPVRRVARSVFVLTTCTNNAVRSGEFDAEFVLPRACSTLLLYSGSSVNNLLLCVR